MRLLLVLVTSALLLGGCKDDQSSNPPQPKTESPAAVQPAPAAQPAAPPAPAGTEKPGIANPASVHCGKVGGQTVIRKDASGGERGFCVFPDGSECEEWALFRGTCKQGDRKKPATTTPKRNPFTRP